jgi:hypothetical protein
MSLWKRFTLRYNGHKKTLSLIISQNTSTLNWKNVRDALEACNIKCERTGNNGVEFYYKDDYKGYIDRTPDLRKEYDSGSVYDDIHDVLKEVAGKPFSDVNQFLEAIML